jgi:nucleotide-binding universal stress UspA family protein
MANAGGTETVAVGVDGSPGSLAALRFAVAEARARKARLRAILAWTIPIGGDLPGGMLPELVADFEKEAERELADCLAGVDTAGLEVEPVTVEGAAGRALLDASEDATILVVGSRGRGGFKGLLLGSVSGQCVDHAVCPVVVVREARDA